MVGYGLSVQKGVGMTEFFDLLSKLQDIIDNDDDFRWGEKKSMHKLIDELVGFYYICKDIKKMDKRVIT